MHRASASAQPIAEKIRPVIALSALGSASMQDCLRFRFTVPVDETPHRLTASHPSGILAASRCRNLTLRICHILRTIMPGIKNALTVLVALTLLSSAAAADLPPTQDDYVDPDAELELLFDGACILTEGVAAGHDGRVYFSDITFSHACRGDDGSIEAGHIWAFDPETGESTVFRSPSGMSNGLKFDAAGNLIAAEGADYGGRRVTRTDMKTGKTSIIAGLYEGRPFNSPNDITIDEQGRIYFSDPRYLGHEPIDQPVMAVYRIDTDGSIERIITDAGKPNGVCISPDQKSLYVVSNDNGSTGIGVIPDDAPLHKGRMALLAYDLSADGTAEFRETLVDYAPQDGPDGLVVDEKGNLYVAVRDLTRPGICIYAPDGTELAYIETELPTNVGFGRGKESRMLYITAGKSLYRIPVKNKGYHLPE
ncbi:MAG: SMP-30/gluconolactonase/LRE family protein [Planctomycetota bacterium]|nr:MAG: SMP-30/gluconolactonase/LRE family protein [Planctomycetota bacterium]